MPTTAPRLTPAERDARAVAWLFPREAARLRAAGLPLPSPTPEGGLPDHALALLARLPGGARGAAGPAPDAGGGDLDGRRAVGTSSTLLNRRPRRPRVGGMTPRAFPPAA